jgi:hypothetical protein
MGKTAQSNLCMASLSLLYAILRPVRLYVAITRAIIEAGQLLDIQVLDRLLIGQGRFVSLKERGLAFG